MKKRLLLSAFIGFCLVWVMNFWPKKNNEHTPSSGLQEPIAQAVVSGVGFGAQIEGEQNEFEAHLKLLPNLEDLSKLSYEEAHHTPEIIKNAGELIGSIQQQGEDNPSQRVSAMNFFKTCVEDDFLAPSIRALCLYKIYHLIPKWKIPLPLDEANIPQEIIDLSMKLH